MVYGRRAQTLSELRVVQDLLGDQDCAVAIRWLHQTALSDRKLPALALVHTGERWSSGASDELRQAWRRPMRQSRSVPSAGRPARGNGEDGEAQGKDSEAGGRRCSARSRYFGASSAEH
jgi:hypothetical protein